MKTLLVYAKKDWNFGFQKNAIFRRKLAKIAENSDHKIDPWFKLPFCKQHFTACSSTFIIQHLHSWIPFEQTYFLRKFGAPQVAALMIERSWRNQEPILQA
jgi:hypothetical protein